MSSLSLAMQIIGQCLLAEVLYVVGLFGVALAGIAICTNMIWQGTEPLYPLLSWIASHMEIVLAGLILLGTVAIFTWGWVRAIRYVSLIAQASACLVDGSDERIRLPSALYPVEAQMNRIKQEAQHNAQLAREAEQRKNDLIVYLAHDLKTPLTSVIGYLTLLRDEGQISEELRRKYLSVSLEKAERLEELINEFFEITRFNLSRLTLEISRVNLTRMLEQIAYEFRPMFDEKRLTCRLEVAGELELKCDANKLERVFDNLIRNAVNYSYAGSEIGIHAEAAENGVRLRFCNHGDTIPPEKLSRIFEQFFRLDSARASRTGGAGLGLAIAREIVELHHGTIEAHSADEMVEFDLFLPNQP